LSFTNKDLVAIGNRYGLHLSGKKNMMVKELAAKIKESKGMTSESDSSLAGPSTMVAPSTTTAQTKGKAQKRSAASQGKESEKAKGKVTEKTKAIGSSASQGKESEKAKRKVTEKTKAIRKGKKRKTVGKNVLEEIDSDFCAGCGNMYYDEDEIPWIGCTSCERWWHRTCCMLDADKDWEIFSAEGAIWCCPVCNS
jgi:hypothetical protein